MTPIARRENLTKAVGPRHLAPRFESGLFEETQKPSMRANDLDSADAGIVRESKAPAFHIIVLVSFDGFTYWDI